MIKLLERTRRPDITFSRNWPHFHYGKSRAATLAPAGRQYQRSFHLGECYLLAVRHQNAIGRHVAQCHPTKKGSKNYCASSVLLARSCSTTAA